MKKQFLLITSFVFIATIAFGGGIVTNTNQSAYWVRTLVRDAATGPDAVYFNPAGLTKLNDGFHFSLNSQTIWQSKDVTDNYENLQPNPKEYLGDVFAPIFPGGYATWKKGKLAVSFGFNPIGGGGGAEYKTGLPSFETQFSNLPTIITAFGIPTTLYSTDIYFKGTSVFFGYQLGVTYQINDMIGAYAGVRYVSAKNTYEGHIKDVMINPQSPALNPGGGMMSAVDFLTAIGQTGFAALVGDRDIDVTEKGSGFCPILGVNLAFGEKVNVGIKYEFKTSLELKQKINSGVEIPGEFEQDSTVNSDMPAMLSIGASYKIADNFSASAGFHYYFDKAANYGKTTEAEPTVSTTNDKLMANNYFEIGFGLEYGITEKLLVSAGYLRAQTGVTEEYQSDLSFSLSSNTIGGGFGYKITDKIMANIGLAYSMYKDGSKEYSEDILIPVPPYNLGTVDAKQDYKKSNLILGIGLDISF
jgi:long-chain fatty acid transport protein